MDKIRHLIILFTYTNSACKIRHLKYRYSLSYLIVKLNLKDTIRLSVNPLLLLFQTAQMKLTTEQ